MRKISLALAFVASLLAIPAHAANFTGKDAALATIIFNNPGNCTTGCTPIFAWSDSTGTNLVAVITAGADGASNTVNGGVTYGRNMVFNGATWDRWTGAVTVAGVATAANQTTINTSIGTTNTTLTSTNTKLDTIIANTAAAIPAGTATIGTVGQLPYPVGAVPLTASATGTTAATTATLAGAVGKTTYICSMSVRANATANTNVTDTITGVITGTLSRALWVPANTAGLGVDEMIYNPCVPASATNTAIAVVSGAPGAGGVVTVNATGYQL